MIHVIENYIEREAKKRLVKHNRDLAKAAFDRRRFERRTGLKATATSALEPSHWSLNKHFDPKYCLSHSKHIAKGLWGSLSREEYRPRPAIQVEVSKPDGGHRDIRISTIPDAALSNLFARNLISRNARMFSASSYAYRHDKGPLDAVLQLRNYMEPEKLFLVNFDFERYFDTIPHSYLMKQLDRYKFLLTTKLERDFIKQSLEHTYADHKNYKAGIFFTCKVGIAQGSSMSLFLANAAAHKLDLELDRKNGVFCRYSDDCVVLTHSYEDAINVVETFFQFSAQTEIKLNQGKSDGIRLVTSRVGEIKSVPSFSFLGYKFSEKKLSVGEKKVASVKRVMSKIIYNNLLYYPKKSLLARDVLVAASKIGI